MLMNSFRRATDNSHSLDKITVLTVNPLNSSMEFDVAINLRQSQLLKKQVRKNAKAREPASLPPPAHPGTAAQPPFCVWASKDILPCVLVVLSIALIARTPLITSQQLPQPTSQTALLNSEREALLICYS